jgi:hypothetical protein
MQQQNFQQAIDNVVQTFKTNIQQLAGEYAISVVRSSLGGALSSTKGNGNGHSNGNGAKRDPAKLEDLKKSFVAFVTKNPGLRIEEINKQMKTTTRDLALPIRKAISEGAVKTKGKKRATTYLPAKQ